jgi:gluconokinase
MNQIAADGSREHVRLTGKKGCDPRMRGPAAGRSRSVPASADGRIEPRTTTVVVMGVSGSGKSTTAAELVRRLGWDFAEGDDFHPPSNVAKMRAGIPLDDEDRWPWLRSIAEWIGRREDEGRSVVVTSSALKRSYRELLRDGHPSVWFAHVDEDPALIRERIEHRTGHYMPASLLDSQLATLEPLQPDEPGAVVNGSGPPEQVVDELLSYLAAMRGISVSALEDQT